MKNIFCIFRLHLQNLPTVASSECMTKKETTKTDCLFLIIFQKLILSNDFFFVVWTTSLAYSVRHHKGSALAAFYQVWCAHFPVCSSFVSSCFRRFILWTNWHRLHLLKILKYITDNWHSRVEPRIFTVTGTFIQVLTTYVANTFTVFAA